MTQTNQAVKAAELPMAGIEWDVVEGDNTEFAVQYPRMQWSHGEAKAQGFMKSGGLFISKDQYPNFVGDGFAPTTLITDDGTEIEGYAARTARLAVIRVKHQWVKDEKHNRNVPLVHALVTVQGCDDIINLSLKGATKALDFQKAFNQHIAQNVSVANRSRPNGVAGLEPFALWFPICASDPVKIVAKDDPSKSSTVTPPVLIAPEKIDRDYVTTLWVGRDNYQQFAGYYKETATWQKLPIWEQRNDAHTSDAPEFTGGEDGRITQGQIDMVAGLIEVKQIDLDDVKAMTLGASDNATNNIKALSRDEATSLIDTMKAL
jgi:hypothetical protein